MASEEMKPHGGVETLSPSCRRRGVRRGETRRRHRCHCRRHRHAAIVDALSSRLFVAMLLLPILHHIGGGEGEVSAAGGGINYELLREVKQFKSDDVATVGVVFSFYRKQDREPPDNYQDDPDPLVNFCKYCVAKIQQQTSRAVEEESHAQKNIRVRVLSCWETVAILGLCRLGDEKIASQVFKFISKIDPPPLRVTWKNMGSVLMKIANKLPAQGKLFIDSIQKFLRNGFPLWRLGELKNTIDDMKHQGLNVLEETCVDFLIFAGHLEKWRFQTWLEVLRSSCEALRTNARLIDLHNEWFFWFQKGAQDIFLPTRIISESDLIPQQDLESEEEEDDDAQRNDGEHRFWPPNYNFFLSRVATQIRRLNPFAACIAHRYVDERKKKGGIEGEELRDLNDKFSQNPWDLSQLPKCGRCGVSGDVVPGSVRIGIMNVILSILNPSGKKLAAECVILPKLGRLIWTDVEVIWYSRFPQTKLCPLLEGKLTGVLHWANVRGGECPIEFLLFLIEKFNCTADNSPELDLISEVFPLLYKAGELEDVKDRDQWVDFFSKFPPSIPGRKRKTRKKKQKTDPHIPSGLSPIPSGLSPKRQQLAAEPQASTRKTAAAATHASGPACHSPGIKTNCSRDSRHPIAEPSSSFQNTHHSFGAPSFSYAHDGSVLLSPPSTSSLQNLAQYPHHPHFLLLLPQAHPPPVSSASFRFPPSSCSNDSTAQAIFHSHAPIQTAPPSFPASSLHLNNANSGAVVTQSSRATHWPPDNFASYTHDNDTYGAQRSRDCSNSSSSSRSTTTTTTSTTTTKNTFPHEKTIEKARPMAHEFSIPTPLLRQEVSELQATQAVTERPVFVSTADIGNNLTTNSRHPLPTIEQSDLLSTTSEPVGLMQCGPLDSSQYELPQSWPWDLQELPVTSEPVGLMQCGPLDSSLYGPPECLPWDLQELPLTSLLGSHSDTPTEPPELLVQRTNTLDYHVAQQVIGSKEVGKKVVTTVAFVFFVVLGAILSFYCQRVRQSTVLKQKLQGGLEE